MSTMALRSLLLGLSIVLLPRLGECNKLSLPQRLPNCKAENGEIKIDLPWKVSEGYSFPVTIWLEPSKITSKEPVTVYMSQTGNVRFEPEFIEIVPRERKKVNATAIKSPSGLVEVSALADDWGCVSASVDTGFRASVSTTIPNNLERGESRPFFIQFLDENGKSTQLDAPASLVLQASSAKIRQGNRPWGNSLKADLDAGASSSPIFEINPTSWPPAQGLLHFEVRINSNQVVSAGTSEFRIVPNWWLALAMAAMGGVLHGVYISFRNSAKPGHNRSSLVIRTAGQLAAGASSGCFAYLLASWDILGIRVDTTSLRGFIVLGFLFAYIGVGAVMKRLVPKDEHIEEAKAPKLRPQADG